MSNANLQRIGIAGAGNWIVDNVKLIDRLPGRGMLGNIQVVTPGTGGAPFNVLVDLARLGAPFPLSGYGVIGDDEGREFIERTCRPLSIDLSGLVTVDSASTSYTDVMTEVGSGDRVFYHCRGANALFGPEHVPVDRLGCRLFHLGYLLLLDRMDEADAEYGTTAARLLSRVQAAGIKTSLDVVSEESDRFCRLVPAALKYTNYLVVNEVEAGRTTGIRVRDAAGHLDGPALAEAAEALHGLGAMECVVIHMPEGAYLRDQAGRRLARGSLALPPGYIQGSVGAGDAFCAGVLFGLHEGWPYEDILGLGSCAAAASLAHPGATEGMRSLAEVRALGQKFPERPPPVAC